jgi:hypothetical protein
MDFSKYLNKNIFQRQIDIHDVYKELYKDLNYSIGSLVNYSDNEVQQQRRRALLANFHYIVKQLIQNDHMIFSKGALIGELNIHMIEMQDKYKHNTAFFQPWGVKKYPDYFDEYLDLLARILLGSVGKYGVLSFSDWDENKVTSLSDKDIKNLTKLSEQYLGFKASKKVDYLDKMFIESIVKFYKIIINKTNNMTRNNKYNFRANAPLIVINYVASWKNLREKVQ